MPYSRSLLTPLDGFADRRRTHDVRHVVSSVLALGVQHVTNVVEINTDASEQVGDLAPCVPMR